MRVADLFCGIGGFRYGFEQAGARVVFSSDINKLAVEYYEKNWGETPSGDITQIDAAAIPDFDILTGGFPCQPFSVVNHGSKGFDDTRGTLFFDILRILEAKQPKAFLLENVAGLKGHNKGQTFNVILSSLKELGYRVKWEVLDSRFHANVPQNRKRIFIVGFKSEKNYDKFFFPKASEQTVFLSDLLEDVAGNTIPEEMISTYENSKYSNRFRQVVTRDSKWINTIRLSHANHYILKDEKRILTVREIARCQGIPDWFVLPERQTKAHDLIGNSVTFTLVENIANNMIQAMKGDK